MAPEMPQESGTPAPSVRRMWIFDPVFAAANGQGPVADPLSARTLAESTTALDQSI